MKSIQLAITALFAIAATAASGAEMTIVCPTELPAEAMKIVTTPRGWQPFISSPLYLHSAAPIAGPPERLGRMVGRTTKRPRGEWTVRYDDLDAPFPEGVWFSCDYGEGNEFSIAKKLDDGVKSCVVKGKKGEKSGHNYLDITCK
jgi:hypothetical protein